MAPDTNIQKKLVNLSTGRPAIVDFQIWYKFTNNLPFGAFWQHWETRTVESRFKRASSKLASFELASAYKNIWLQGLLLLGGRSLRRIWGIWRRLWLRDKCIICHARACAHGFASAIWAGGNKMHLDICTASRQTTNKQQQWIYCAIFVIYVTIYVTYWFFGHAML